MKVEVRREPPSRAVLEVELPPEELQRGLERAYHRLNARVAIPGFRKGKAPRALLERYVGKDAVYEEAVNLLVPDAYSQAVDQAGVRPLTRPKIDVGRVEEGRPLRFTATVDLVPEVRLGDYRAIRVPVPPAVVSDQDVATAIEDLRTRHATLASLGDRSAEFGDFVLVRVLESTDASGRFLAGKEYLIEIGGGVFPVPVEQALIGVTAGARRRVGTGQGDLEIEVADVKRRQLPELDADFARAVGNAASVDELRDRMRERLQREAEARAQEAYEQAVVDALLAGATIEVPDSLVEHELQHMVADLTETLQRRGLTLPRYLEGVGQTEEQLAADLRPRAERRVRVQLAIDELARLEGIEPSEEEITREVENVARRLQLDDGSVREWLAQRGRGEALVAALRRRKTLARLVSIARGDVP